MRARLTLALAAIVAVALAGTYVATYRGTGSEVRGAIDNDLRQDVTAFDRTGIGAALPSPTAVAGAATAYIHRQPSFGAVARLFIVRVVGGQTITNEPELLGVVAEPAGEVEPPAVRNREVAEAQRLRAAPPGLQSLDLVDAGDVRLLVRPIVRHGIAVAYVGVGEPLDAVRRAQNGVQRTFLLAGSLALLVTVLAGYLIATGLSRPLRRMARTAAEVDAGGRSQFRLSERHVPAEVRILAESFDHMLDRLDDAFSRQRGFVADASHELRTPLTAIRGQLEVLARQPDPAHADIERVTGVVRTEVERMERLVNDLLLLARADGSEFIRSEPLDVEPFLIELCHALVPTADRRFELGPVPHGSVLADPDRIAQVIRNLARNAVQHTQPGGHVRLVAEAVNGSLEIAIEDDGPGIPPAEWELVFDRFHRADRARARSAGGAGLGLAIARAIVEAHGGTIHVEQARLGGARVAFELPGWRPQSAAPAPPVAR